MENKVAMVLDVPQHYAATSGLLLQVLPTPLPSKDPTEALPKHTIALWNFGFAHIL
ncbi:MAG: hypothetical protein ACKPKO_25220 [Candidatus Fonsibacter sp.]